MRAASTTAILFALASLALDTLAQVIVVTEYASACSAVYTSGSRSVTIVQSTVTVQPEPFDDDTVNRGTLFVLQVESVSMTRKRQNGDRASSYVMADGGITTNPSDAARYHINPNGQIVDALGDGVSSSDGTGYTAFALSSDIGDVSTQFLSRNLTLLWTNKIFSTGSAQFYISPDSITNLPVLVARFSGPIRQDWQRVVLKLAPVSGIGTASTGSIGIVSNLPTITGSVETTMGSMASSASQIATSQVNNSTFEASSLSSSSSSSSTGSEKGYSSSSSKVSPPSFVSGTTSNISPESAASSQSVTSTDFAIPSTIVSSSGRIGSKSSMRLSSVSLTETSSHNSILSWWSTLPTYSVPASPIGPDNPENPSFTVPSSTVSGASALGTTSSASVPQITPTSISTPLMVSEGSTSSAASIGKVTTTQSSSGTSSSSLISSPTSAAGNPASTKPASSATFAASSSSAAVSLPVSSQSRLPPGGLSSTSSSPSSVASIPATSSTTLIASNPSQSPGSSSPARSPSITSSSATILSLGSSSVTTSSSKSSSAASSSTTSSSGAATIASAASSSAASSMMSSSLATSSVTSSILLSPSLASSSAKFSSATISSATSSSTALSSTALSSTPLSSTPLSSTPLSSTPLSSTPLSSTPLSSGISPSSSLSRSASSLAFSSSQSTTSTSSSRTISSTATSVTASSSIVSPTSCPGIDGQTLSMNGQQYIIGCGDDTTGSPQSISQVTTSWQDCFSACLSAVNCTGFTYTGQQYGAGPGTCLMTGDSPLSFVRGIGNTYVAAIDVRYLALSASSASSSTISAPSSVSSVARTSSSSVIVSVSTSTSSSPYVLTSPTPCSFGDPQYFIEDDSYCEVDLPFPMQIYGGSSTTTWPSTNGFISIGEGSIAYEPQTLPTDQLPPNTVCPYWDDLCKYEGTEQGIFYQFDSSNTSVTFEYYIGHAGFETASPVHFTVQYASASPGVFTYHYYGTGSGETANGANATVGAQGLTASGAQTGAQYSFELASIVPGLVVVCNTNSNTCTRQT